MPRTALTVQNAPAAFGAAGTTLTFAAGDVANGNSFVSTGREILIARNDDASPKTVTVQSIACSHGRETDAVKQIAAGAYAIFQMFPTDGFQQSDGKVWIDVDDADLKLAVVKYP